VGAQGQQVSPLDLDFKYFQFLLLQPSCLVPKTFIGEALNNPEGKTKLRASF
jgi:hypothetical protein